MKILVTGGAGFIGSHVVDKYIEAGHEVAILDNLSTGHEKNINPKAEFFKVDLCDKESAKIVKNIKPDIINHHAAQIDVRVSVADPVNDIRVNIMSLVSLIEAARTTGLKKVIFASSGGTVYGEQKTFPADETHSTWPISPYGLNKLTCEKYLYYYNNQYKIPYVALRYANIYGPRQNPHGEAGVIAIFIKKMLGNEEPVINGDGKQSRDYVFVKDVAEANFLALKPEAFGAYNVGTTVETDVNAIFNMLKEITGSKCNEIHRDAMPGEQQRSSISSEKLQKELGWKITTNIEQGLIKTADWFKYQNDKINK